MEKVSKEKKLELYGLLLKSRRVEERLVELSMQGKIAGWIHAMLGQEAVGIGVAINLRKTDVINNTHRGRAIILGKGAPLNEFMAETLAKATGPCLGIAGEMHYCDSEYGILGTAGTLGANIPIINGMALAARHRGTDQVFVSIMGDGTVDGGYFHEGMNIASRWKLPVVFVVENNRWAQFVPQEATAAQPEIWRKAVAYNMPGKGADGNDILEVYETARAAIERARKGEGPTLLEYKVHRWMGHYVGDAQRYRDPKDIEAARQNDPLARFQAILIEEKLLTQQSIQESEKKVKNEIDEAILFAENSPPADPKQVSRFVCFEGA